MYQGVPWTLHCCRFAGSMGSLSDSAACIVSSANIKRSKIHRGRTIFQPYNVCMCNTVYNVLSLYCIFKQYSMYGV